MELPVELEKMRQRVEDGLRTCIARIQGPRELLEAMQYSLFAGGKRLRPILCIASAELFEEAGLGLDPMPAACALEYIHTYSLIHDDLPAMDNDDIRRGRPTSHKKFGEAMAILAGDALLTEAFTLTAQAYRGGGDRPLAALAELAFAAGAAGMVGGQVLDIRHTGESLSQAALEQVHRLKTGALLLGAARIGAILGGASDQSLNAIDRYGRRIGLAFQVADDVLDVTGTRESLGKSAGKDAAQGKTTYAELLGIDAARAYCTSICAEAIRELEVFGPSAVALRALADFIAQSIDPACEHTPNAGCSC